MTTEQTRTAHTPGPWETANYGLDRYEIQGCGTRIAVVDRIEDARLIAAAPALLRIAQMVTLLGPGDEGVEALRKYARDITSMATRP